jgi:hypothetical protein
LTTLEAHERYALVPDHPEVFLTVRLPGGVEVELPAWPALMTAAASLTGWLDDCQDGDQLPEAVGHFLACYESGVFTREQWYEEAGRVIQEVMDWGLQQELSCSTG